MLRQTDRTIGIRVRFPDSFRYNYDDVRQFPILTPAKQIVPLSALARIDSVQGENQLLRENGRLMVDLQARLENRGLGSAIRDVQSVLSSIHFPVGTTYEIGGLYESQQSSFRDLLSVLALALGAVFIVLVIQFRAFLPALIIMSAAPLSVLGVFAMLLATGTALNVSSFMGIILMVGLVVKNGIILFELRPQALERARDAPGRSLGGCRQDPRAADSHDHTLHALWIAPSRSRPGLRSGIAEAAGPGGDRRADRFPRSSRSW